MTFFKVIELWEEKMAKDKDGTVVIIPNGKVLVLQVLVKKTCNDLHNYENNRFQLDANT